MVPPLPEPEQPIRRERKKDRKSAYQQVDFTTSSRMLGFDAVMLDGVAGFDAT
jgi:hypothetical protein